MTGSRIERLRRRLAARLDRKADGDGGFILLESIVAISLITVIMGALGAEYVTNLITTSHHRAEKVAVQLADSTVEGLRALHPSDLLTGRDRTSVISERNTLSAIATVSPWIATTSNTLAYDSSVSSGGSTATVPTSAMAQKPGSVSYAVYQYLDCYASSTTGTCTSTSGALNYIRATVAVVWTQQGCTSNTCAYVTSTLINADDDPTFQVNQTLPDAPIVNDPGDQTVAVGDTVSLSLTVKNGKGVAPFTWAQTGGTLPSGLSISPAGLVSGTVTGSASAAKSFTVTVTDAFLRTASDTFKWTVLPQLAFNTVNDQTNITTDSVHVAVSATGGTGSGYTYSDPSSSLPPGLSISSGGVITGTPTTPAPHTYNVTLKVVDGSGTRSATTSFRWTINYPPISITNPGTLVSTIGRPATYPMAASGGDGNFSWSATGLPAGLSISSTTGAITGTPTNQSSYSVTVTASDSSAGVTPQTMSFTWKIVGGPTITDVGNQRNTKGQTLSVPTSGTCPNSPCTYSINGQPNGIVINSSTGTISGTVAGNASTASNVTVKITDASGATATTSSFTWTVDAAPTLSGLSTDTVTEGDSESVAISYTCPRTSCVINLSGAVPGIGLKTSGGSSADNSSATSLTVSAASGTVYLTGGIQNSAVSSGNSKSYSPSLTITDGNGYTPSSSTATWLAYAAPSLSGLSSHSFYELDSDSVSITYTCPFTSCTIKLAGSVPGIGLKTSANSTADNTSATSLTVSSTSGTVYLTGKVQSSAVTGTTSNSQTYTPSLTITDADGYAPSASTATWKAYQPTITGVTAISKSRGSTVSQTLTYSCSVSPCTVAVTAVPSGIGVDTDTSGSVSSSVTVTTSGTTAYLRGTISSSATVKTYSVVVTLTDGNGATSTSSASWTVT